MKLAKSTSFEGQLPYSHSKLYVDTRNNISQKYRTPQYCYFEVKKQYETNTVVWPIAKNKNFCERAMIVNIKIPIGICT